MTEQRRPAQVDLDRSPPVVGVGPQELAGDAGPRIVDQEVDGSQLAFDAGHDGLDSQPVGDVPRGDQRLAAGFLDLGGHLVQLVDGACHQGDRDTAGAELERDLAADAAASAGDQGNLTGEVRPAPDHPPICQIVPPLLTRRSGSWTSLASGTLPG